MYISIFVSIHTFLVHRMKKRIEWKMSTNMEWEILPFLDTHCSYLAVNFGKHSKGILQLFSVCSEHNIYLNFQREEDLCDPTAVQLLFLKTQELDTQGCDTTHTYRQRNIFIAIWQQLKSTKTTVSIYAIKNILDLNQRHIIIYYCNLNYHTLSSVDLYAYILLEY